MRFAIRKWNAERVYYLLSAGISLAQTVMFTVLAVYYVNQVGMNPFQLVLVGTVLEVTILLLEVPTGALADTYSRRLSVIVAMFVLGAAWLIEGSFPVFGMVLVAEVIRGLGETFQSGALDAWLADEVGEERVGPVYLRSGQIGRVVGIAGIVASVAVASVRLNYAVLAGGVLFLGLGVFLALFMPETGFKPAPAEQRESWKSVLKTFRQGARVVRGSRLLLFILAVSLVSGAASEGFDRLWEAHFLMSFRFPALGNFSYVVWFGILNIAMSLVGLAVTQLLLKRLERLTQNLAAAARLLMALNLFSVASIVAFALAGNFYAAFAAMLVGSVFGGLYYPIYNSWLVRQIDPGVRATVLSMMSQSNALGQAAMGPGVGAIGSIFSIRAALVAAGVLFSPLSALFAWASRRHRRDALPAEAELPAEV